MPNNRAARLLIFPNFSLPTRLIWTYTLIKFQEKILPTRLLRTYTVIDFFFFFLADSKYLLLTYLYLPTYVLWPLAKRVQNWIVDGSIARDFKVPENFITVPTLVSVFQRKKWLINYKNINYIILKYITEVKYWNVGLCNIWFLVGIISKNTSKGFIYLQSS